MLIIGILLLLANISLLIGGGYVVLKYGNYFVSIANSFAEFFTAKSQSEPSDFGKAVDAVGSVIGQSTAIAVQAAIRGSLGGTMKGVNAELEQEAYAANPQLAMMEVLPKSLKKNPLALMGLQAIMGRLVNQNGGAPGGDLRQIPGNGRVKFDL